MAVIARAQVTLASITDIKATYRYYLLQSSTLAKPAKPTANPPGGNWNDTEPTYTEGSTNSLYEVELTVFSDETFQYSEVSLSSSYEAAKAAYNKAAGAESAANDASKVATNYLSFSDVGLVVGDMTGNTLGSNALIDANSFNIRNGNTKLASYKADSVYLGTGNTPGSNVLIDTDSFNIRNGDTILASYQGDSIYLGKSSTKSIIDLCNGTATLKNANDSTDFDWYRLLLTSRDSIGLETTGEITMDANVDDGAGRSSSATFSLTAHKPWLDYDTVIDYYDAKFNVNVLSSLSDGNCSSSNSSIYMDVEEFDLTHKYKVHDDVSSCSIVLNGGITLTADDGISMESSTYCHQKLVMDNNIAIYAKDTGNTDIQILTMSGGNNTVLGYGGYKSDLGQTNIYGTDIWFKVKNAVDTSYYPYYKKETLLQ